MGSAKSTSVAWNDELRLQVMDAYFRRGESAARIAREHPGATRNAIIGVIHRHAGRLGFGSFQREGASAVRIVAVASTPAPRPRPALVATVAAQPSRPAPVQLRPVQQPAVMLAPRPKGSVKLLDLTPTTCRFPVGRATGADQAFCGAQVEEQPFCAGCRKTAYLPRPKRAATEFEVPGFRTRRFR